MYVETVMFLFSYSKFYYSIIEVEDIKKIWQEYAEELYKKGLNDPDIHNGVITHLEPDILECEVEWALGSVNMNKASGGDGISAELFQILKDVAIKVLYSICQQIWKTWKWPQDWKKSVFIPIPKKGNAKECSNYHTIALISHASKVMLKTFKLGFNGMWTKNFQMYKLDLEKAEESEVILLISAGSSKKQESFRKTSTSALLTTLKLLTQRRQWHPTPVLLPGKSHGRRSLVGCNPWGREESDTTVQLHFHF